jgi:hypothetical protein
LTHEAVPNYTYSSLNRRSGKSSDQRHGFTRIRISHDCHRSGGDRDDDDVVTKESNHAEDNPADAAENETDGGAGDGGTTLRFNMSGRRFGTVERVSSRHWLIWMKIYQKRWHVIGVILVDW